RILLVGGDADFNVGDAAIRHALCATLVRADPGARITIVAHSRHRAAPPPGVVRILPKGAPHALTQWRAARRQQLIIVGGGGLFQDDDSRIKMPYWAARLAALRASGTVIAGHSLGAGPLMHAESRLMARLACATMRSVSVRDQFALQALQPCTSHALMVVPDPAFMLEPRPASEARALLRQLGIAPGRALIGVTLRRWFHARGGFIPHRARDRLGWGRSTGQQGMTRLLATLAAVIPRIARELDATVLFLPGYRAGHEGDVDACAALAARMPHTATCTAHIVDPCLFKAVTGELRLLISARMHPLILAAGMDVPLVGLAYNGKFAGCLDALGAGRQLLNIDQLVADDAGALLEHRIRAALDQCGDSVAQRAAVLASQSRAATLALLDLLP